MLSRQVLRQAKRRVNAERFPFPEFSDLLRITLFKDHKVFFMTEKPDRMKTNLSGETKIYDMEEFYQLLVDYKKGIEDEARKAQESDHAGGDVCDSVELAE